MTSSALFAMPAKVGFAEEQRGKNEADIEAAARTRQAKPSATRVSKKADEKLWDLVSHRVIGV